MSKTFTIFGHTGPMKGITRKWPEVVFTLAMVGVMLVLSIAFSLPIVVPTGSSAAFVGVHYIYPLIGVSIWAIVMLLSKGSQVSWSLIVALPCYAIVLFVHFNLKLWVPHVNPYLFDDIYWQSDQYVRPIVDAAIWARHFIDPIIPINSNFYMTGFILLFYVSFCYHAYRTPKVFRELFLAALIFQGLGGISYMIMPALGPFLYEEGVGELVANAQHGMLELHRQSVAMGPTWLRTIGGTAFTEGLGAMPSLHTGGAFLFFVFALRHARILVPLYTLIFAFIVGRRLISTKPQPH